MNAPPPSPGDAPETTTAPPPPPRDLRAEFRDFFGEPTGERKIPGNTGSSRTLLALLRLLRERDKPAEWTAASDLASWINPPPVMVARVLAGLGQGEAAWALAQLEYAEHIKAERRSLRPDMSKGGSLCNIALVGEALRSLTLLHHFAALATAGDVCAEHVNPALQHGGLAATLLERQEPHDAVEKFREVVRDTIATLRSSHGDSTPIHLEALLARKWFPKPRALYVEQLAPIRSIGASPFVELLLESMAACGSAVESGTLFEMATALLLARTPGFYVRSARKTSDAQTDLVVSYRWEPLSNLSLPQGPGLVECKSSGRVSSATLREFGARCSFHRVGFGIMVANDGITGDDKPEAAFAGELVRRRLLLDGVVLLVLGRDHLTNRSVELRGLQQPLADDYDTLVFGPIG